jgi:hypothetical protein
MSKQPKKERAARPNFLQMPHHVYESSAFKSLSSVEKCLLFALLYRYRGTATNGKIRLGVREAETDLRCGRATVCRAFKSLQATGLVTCTYKGHQVNEFGRPDAPSRWRINFMPTKDGRVLKWTSTAVLKWNSGAVLKWNIRADRCPVLKWNITTEVHLRTILKNLLTAGGKKDG